MIILYSCQKCKALYISPPSLHCQHLYLDITGLDTRICGGAIQKEISLIGNEIIGR